MSGWNPYDYTDAAEQGRAGIDAARHRHIQQMQEQALWDQQHAHAAFQPQQQSQPPQHHQGHGLEDLGLAAAGLYLAYESDQDHQQAQRDIASYPYFVQGQTGCLCQFRIRFYSDSPAQASWRIGPQRRRWGRKRTIEHNCAQGQFQAYCTDRNAHRVWRSGGYQGGDPNDPDPNSW